MAVEAISPVPIGIYSEGQGALVGEQNSMVVLFFQCLDRRMGNLAQLRYEMWEAGRSDKRGTVDWRFAGEKFPLNTLLYPA
jgi:hypothetical protein